jgi:hypothetical protein
MSEVTVCVTCASLKRQTQFLMLSEAGRWFSTGLESTMLATARSIDETETAAVAMRIDDRLDPESVLCKQSAGLNILHQESYLSNHNRC